MTWKNRIVDYREMSPDELIENPKNWRKHPRFQQDALADMLGEVGTVTGVVFNQRTGRLVDGHLRVELAKKQGQETLPVMVVDLSEEEEDLVLATFDPIGALAEKDLDRVAALVGELPEIDGSLGALLRRVNEETNDVVAEWGGMPEFTIEGAKPHRQILVSFKNDEDIADFATRLLVKVTDKTKAIWYPEQEIDRVADLRYVTEE